jgi:hypothetical protein
VQLNPKTGSLHVVFAAPDGFTKSARGQGSSSRLR